MSTHLHDDGHACIQGHDGRNSSLDAPILSVGDRTTKLSDLSSLSLFLMSTTTTFFFGRTFYDESYYDHNSRTGVLPFTLVQ